jgi:hypothetical protein
LIRRGVLEALPTFSEVATAAAFELFRRGSVNVAVLEVGLGGRLDATNIVTPIATAITSIDFDHQAAAQAHARIHRPRKGGHRQARRSACLWTRARGGRAGHSGHLRIAERQP